MGLLIQKIFMTLLNQNENINLIKEGKIRSILPMNMDVNILDKILYNDSNRVLVYCVVTIKYVLQMRRKLNVR
jgi:hypothetical protein